MAQKHIGDWDTPQYIRLLENLERAFAAGDASFVHEVDGTLAIRLGARSDVDEEFASAIDQVVSLLIFAFASAPDSIVESWANADPKSDVEKIIEWVRLSSSATPTIRSEWQAQVNSSLPVLGVVGTDFVVNPETSALRALVTINTFIPDGGPFWNPKHGSETAFSFAATTNELAYLIELLRSVHTSMPERIDETEEAK